MNTRVGRRLAPMVVVPALLLAMAGCSDDEGGDEPKSDETSATDEPSEAATTDPDLTIQPPDLPVPPTVNQLEGASDDVEYDASSCKTDAGTQTVSGTVTSSAKKATGYLVQISWTDGASNVRGLGYEVIRGIKPQEEREWEIEADVADGATQCVLYVVRGVIPKKG